jgi:hypothetical protein
MNEQINKEFTSLEEGFRILIYLLEERLRQVLNNEQYEYKRKLIFVPEYHNTIFCRLIATYEMSFEERLTLIIALAPALHPEILEILIHTEIRNKVSQGIVGGNLKEPSRTFIPTIRSVMFILGNTNATIHQLFAQEHYFIKENILSLGNVAAEVPFADAPIYLSDEYYHLFTSGIFEPRHGEKFPAQKISTSQDWEDLVIRNNTYEQIVEIKTWIHHAETIMSNAALAKKIKKGYRALFYGSSGTGKTMTASLLGKSFNMPVYRVDLSMVVSKYIGETEKNLEKIFNMAESRHWILFFDEAEALFGKRGATNDAHDRYANQEISYLLQRIENFDSILILATNKLFDLDEAFTRRFQSMIEFPEPNAAERLLLWNKTFEGTGFEYEDINFESLAATKDITGGMLVNVLRYAAIKVMERGNNVLTQEDLIMGLKKEYAKENRMWVDMPVQNRRQAVTLSEYAKNKGLAS